MTIAIDQNLLLAEPITVGGLAIYALLDAKAPERPEGDFRSLEEAFEARAFTVEEVDSGGSVPHLLVRNHGDQPVLLLAGEVVTGGKQDRVIIEDVVIQPGTEHRIKVNCVEHGRWSVGGGSFGYGGHAESVLLRKLAANSQSETWAEVARLNALHGAKTSTGSYRASMEEQRVELTDRLETELDKLEKVVGLVLSLDGELQSAELYGHPTLFSKTRRSLLNSYVREADGMDILEGEHPPAPSPEEAASWVRKAREVPETGRAAAPSSVQTRHEGDRTDLFSCVSESGVALRTRIQKKPD